jgi:fimbrial chaperone protein
MLRMLWRAAGLSLAAILFWAVPAGAAQFGVSSVLVELSPQKSADALTVSNEGEQPVTVQARLFAWSQQEGKDVQAPTSDLIVTPPIFTIPPGKFQVMRIGLRKPLDAARESSYRLELQEVPQQAEPAQGTLRLLLKMSLPVFFRAADAAPMLAWQARRSAAGTVTVAVRNQGTAHAKLGRLELRAPGAEQPLAERDVGAYVLAGQAREFSLPLAARPEGGRIRIIAHTNRGRVEADAVVE